MLTYKQKEVLEFIISYQNDNKVSPTIQEITDFIGVNSLSTTHQHLESLEEKGFIKRHKKQARSIEITEFAKKVVNIEESSVLPPAKTTKVEKILNTIVQGDALELLRKLPDQCIDLLIADPPYNLSKGMSLKLASGSLVGTGGNWEKVMQKWDDYDLLGYMEFTELWLREAKRVLKPTGSMWVFGTYHNSGIINTLMQLLGIEIINEVVWYKRNAFPNLAGRRLTASHETLIWAHAGKKRKYTFNYDFSKSYSDKSDELKAAGKQMRTVWDIPNNKERFEIALGRHPTQKPLKICKRMIELTTKEGDVVLSPFSGSGSECLAAKLTGRDYIGFEIEEEFVDLSRRRLDQQIASQESLL
ncbi:site-specific DNA-methyltransferase [Candidatus Saccharibacteria bacterium]|nr:site-specific DNA-methyltransferase [Candidatus Saccharibacteria bacterium]